MAPSKRPSLGQVCGVECEVHGGAPCIVPHIDAAHDPTFVKELVAEVRSASEKNIPPDIADRLPAVTTRFIDACSPHMHTHSYLMEDGCLLEHRWRQGGLLLQVGAIQARTASDEWIMRLPGNQGPGGQIDREEWESRFAGGTVISTDPRAYKNYWRTR